MDVSIFIAKILAIYLFVVGLALLTHAKRYRAVCQEIKGNHSQLFLIGLFSLIFGALIVTNHNLWVMDWRVIITVLGWLALIKGGFKLLLPQLDQKILTKFLGCQYSYHVCSVISLLLGLYLGYQCSLS